MASSRDDLVAAATHAVGGPGDAADRLEELIAAQLRQLGSLTAVGLRAIVVHHAVRVEDIMASLTPLFWAGVAREKGTR